MSLRLPVVLLIGSLLPISTGSAQEQAKRPMTFSDLAAIRRVSDPQVSPNGKWVMFSVTTVSLEKNSKVNHLWAVPIDMTGRAHPLTDGAGESNARFSPDGKSVMYTSSEGGSSQIWVAPWKDDDGTMGDGHAVTALETEADGAIWAPDSRHFLFVSSVYPECQSKSYMGRERNEQEVACNAQKDAAAAKNPVKAQVFDHLLYRHWNALTGPKHSHIFYADAGSGAHDPPTDLSPASLIGDHEAPTFSLGGPLGYAISPDGKELAYEVNLDKVAAESTNNDIFVLKLGAEPYTARKVSTSRGSDDGPQYSPDGKWLAWRSQARNGYESDKFRLMVMDRSTEAVSEVLPKFDGWVDEFIWKADSSGFYFASSSEGAVPIFKVDRNGANLGIHYGDDFGDLRAVATGNGNGVIAAMTSVNQPTVLTAPIRDAQFVKYPDECAKNCSMEGTAYTDLNEPLLNILDLPDMESFTFAGAGGSKVEGFIIRPPGFDATKKYPLKFLIHGGPQGAWGDSWSYRWNPELLAANGYVVVMINPRGSTGYGQKFLEQVSGDWGGRPFEDLMKGLDYAEQNYPFIDKNLECALGASYGGYMANWVLTHTDRFKCIVTHDGMFNPQSAFGSTEELWFNEWEFRQLAGKGADAVVDQNTPAHPWDFYDKPADQDPFRKWSPMMSIKNAHTPTLVIHGQLDYRLDVSEGLQLFTALQLLHVPSKMLYFPDEGHWVMKPKNSELWHETVNDWCDRWLGVNKYASVGPEHNPALPVAVPVAAKNATKTASRAHKH